MSRRTGQNGSVFQHAKPWDSKKPAYGRFWIDVASQGRQRSTVSLGFCRTQSIAERKLREHIETNGINSKQTFTTSTAPATTFRQQADMWLVAVASRRRKPVKPATIHGWRQSLNHWVLPSLGDKLLSEITNGALKELIDKMAAAGLAPQSICTHVKTAKMVVASAINSEGEQIYPRKWNHDFIGLPIVRRENQRRPTVTEAQITKILGSAKRREAVLIALLAGTGLRIGEALALERSDFSVDYRVLNVSWSIWGGQKQDPKTPNAVRPIDVLEPLAKLLREYAAGKSGYLFATSSGRPMSQRNILRTLYTVGVRGGLHAFRRFRTETLRRARVPQDLINLWLGWSKINLSDFYAGGLRDDETRRREWCDKAGLGFSLVGLHGPQKEVQIDSVKAA